MKITKQFFYGLGIGICIALVTIPAGKSFSVITRFTPAKPAASQTIPLDDEQQGILAVRSIKPSVVIVSGVTTPTGSPGLATISPFESLSGSGIIVSSNGLIVTNAHVVDNAGYTYTVTLDDGRQYPAVVKGLDEYNDVALLQINASGLPAAKLGNSSDLETGQTVFAIGDALGQYQDTVTRGVISGVGRSVDVSASSSLPRLDNLIQTDAAINHGNSGGPLIDMDGMVVGMTTAIDTEGYSLNFAVPVNTVKDSMNQLNVFGKVSKPYLGLSFQTVTPALTALDNLPVTAGAYVLGVASGSPASLVGLQPGDVVTAINHQQLSESNELDSVVSQYEAGTQVVITYYRNGKSNDVQVILGEF